MMPGIPSYDWIVINTSAGKDSQTMMRVVVNLATACGFPIERIVAVHADLGDVEWKGTRELAEAQAKHHGLRFIAVHREQGLLDQIEARGMFPDSKNRYCTSDHKRDQIAKVFTALVNESGISGRPVRILNCMGMRAQESPARAKLKVFETNKRVTNGKRHVDNWLPIHNWTEEEVWRDIRESGVPHHPAYDLGLPRLSCVFCVFAPKHALAIAGKHNPELLDRYAEMEKRIGHTFRADFSIAALRDELLAQGSVQGCTPPCSPVRTGALRAVPDRAEMQKAADHTERAPF
jgi:3'-phosphoadenosine 5'-phosphosulfate sulfotransferase (PAPS reductase)/FAD synthetase